jgi:hypothetical protein
LILIDCPVLHNAFGKFSSGRGTASSTRSPKLTGVWYTRLLERDERGVLGFGAWDSDPDSDPDSDLTLTHGKKIRSGRRRKWDGMEQAVLYQLQ